MTAEPCPFCGAKLKKIVNTWQHPYSEGPDRRDCFLLRICKESIHENLLEYWNTRSDSAPKPMAPPPPIQRAGLRWKVMDFTINGKDRITWSGMVDLGQAGRPA